MERQPKVSRPPRLRRRGQGCIRPLGPSGRFCQDLSWAADGCAFLQLTCRQRAREEPPRPEKARRRGSEKLSPPSPLLEPRSWQRGNTEAWKQILLVLGSLCRLGSAVSSLCPPTGNPPKANGRPGAQSLFHLQFKNAEATSSPPPASPQGESEREFLHLPQCRGHRGSHALVAFSVLGKVSRPWPGTAWTLTLSLAQPGHVRLWGTETC